jgi:curved DNA-binding protein CbpA
MMDHPGFDPFEALGVSFDADEIVIQLAYRARIRQAHPDLAGPTGLETAKRLNIARDWLLDPERRARLPGARPAAAPTPGYSRPTRSGPRGRSNRASVDASDLGPRTAELHAFLRALEALSPDERARLNYSLGDAPPPDVQPYLDYLDPVLWERSRVLRDAVERAWARGTDEVAPTLPRLGRLLPTGFLAANAAAQWILLEASFREALGGLTVRGERVVDTFAVRCRAPWSASVSQLRYGPYQAEVLSFLEAAHGLPADGAERLARSWRQHMGRDGRGHPSEHIGPGVWLPSPPNYPDALKVSGYVAAVDASRIVPPRRLAERHHPGFRFGLRLTAHVLALGLGQDSSRDYLRPWRDALGSDYAVRDPLRQQQRAG